MPSDLVGAWECVQHDPDTAEALFKELGRLYNKTRFQQLFYLTTNFSSLHNYIITKTGVNFMLRKAAKFVKPVCEISPHGDTWTIKITSSVKNNTVDFLMGVPKKYEAPDGRHVEVRST